MASALNGPLELAIRVLAILTAAYPAHMDINRLVLLDHGLLHSADLGGPESLHPALPIRTGELGMKRERIQKGVEVLVRAGLARVRPDAEGIHFSAGERADGFVRLLETEYARALVAKAEWAVAQFGGMTDVEIRDVLRSVSGHWAEEFEQIDTSASEVDV